MPSLDQPTQYLLATAAGLAALGYLWRRWVVPGFRAAYRGFRAVQSALDLIQAQLRVNGGASLMDKVNLIEPHHRIIAGRLDALDAKHTEILVRVSALERAQGEMERP